KVFKTRSAFEQFPPSLQLTIFKIRSPSPNVRAHIKPEIIDVKLSTSKFPLQIANPVRAPFLVQIPGCASTRITGMDHRSIFYRPWRALVKRGYRCLATCYPRPFRRPPPPVDASHERVIKTAGERVHLKT